MGYFPFFMDIAGKKGVIVGGGKVAARKVEKLIPFGPVLTVVASRIEECVRRQGKGNMLSSLFFMERGFRTEDVDGADFVIAATDDERLNGQISDLCKARKIPVNVVDDKKKCTFFFPALIREGSLTVGISTDGKSPVAAAWMRQEISGMLPENLGDVVDLMGQIRPWVMEKIGEESARKAILERIFLYCLERGGRVTVTELQEAFVDFKG